MSHTFPYKKIQFLSVVVIYYDQEEVKFFLQCYTVYK